MDIDEARRLLPEFASAADYLGDAINRRFERLTARLQATEIALHETATQTHRKLEETKRAVRMIIAASVVLGVCAGWLAGMLLAFFLVGHVR